MRRLYADFYHPPVMGGDYSELYKAFADAATPLAALRAVSRPVDRHMIAYMGEDFHIHVVHRLDRFHVGLGDPASPYAGHVFGIMDEISELGPVLGRIQDTMFEEVVARKVPVPDEIRAVLDLDGTLEQIPSSMGPFPKAGTVTVRMAVVVPPPHQAQMLRGIRNGMITPAMLWMIAEDLLSLNPTATGCRNFINWCRVAVAGGVGLANPLIEPGRGPVMTMPNSSLGRCRRALLESDFPPVVSASASPGLVDAIAALGDRTMEREAASAAAAATKAAAAAALKASPSRIWPAGVHTLLNICQVPDESYLPPVYSAIAGNELKACLSTLQDAVRAPPFDDRLSLPSVGLPTVSIERSRSVQGLHFMEGKEDMDGALSLFGSSYFSQKVVADLNRHNRLFVSHTEGNTSMTPGELRDFNQLQKMQLPESWFQLRQVLGAYHRWIQILLGEGHVLPVAFHQLVTDLDGLAIVDFETQFRGPFPCAQLMYTIQVYTWQWFNRQKHTPVIQYPRYEALIEAMQCQSWVKPSLAALPHPLPELLRSVAPGATATAPTPSSTASSATGAPVTELITPSENRIPGIYNAKLVIGALIKAKAPPRTEKGHMFCLNYHVRGSCVSNCRYQRDHQSHSAADRATLVAYLAEATPLVHKPALA